MRSGKFFSFLFVVYSKSRKDYVEKEIKELKHEIRS